jgi:hypothetical protein
MVSSSTFKKDVVVDAEDSGCVVIILKSEDAFAWLEDQDAVAAGNTITCSHEEWKELQERMKDAGLTFA